MFLSDYFIKLIIQFVDEISEITSLRSYSFLHLKLVIKGVDFFFFNHFLIIEHFSIDSFSKQTDEVITIYNL